MLSDKRINIKEFQETLEGVLKRYPVSAETAENKRGKVYKIKTRMATMEITLGEQWVGYGLQIDEKVIKKEFGTAEDTDNYALDGEYADITLSIFHHALTILTGLLEGKVYVGTFKDSPALAVPVTETHYKIFSRDGRFSTRNHEIPKDDIGQMEQRQTID